MARKPKILNDEEKKLREENGQAKRKNAWLSPTTTPQPKSRFKAIQDGDEEGTEVLNGLADLLKPEKKSAPIIKLTSSKTEGTSKTETSLITKDTSKSKDSSVDISSETETSPKAEAVSKETPSITKDSSKTKDTAKTKGTSKKTSPMTVDSSIIVPSAVETPLLFEDSVAVDSSETVEGIRKVMQSNELGNKAKCFLAILLSEMKNTIEVISIKKLCEKYSISDGSYRAVKPALQRVIHIEGVKGGSLIDVTEFMKSIPSSVAEVSTSIVSELNKEINKENLLTKKEDNPKITTPSMAEDAPDIAGENLALKQLFKKVQFSELRLKSLLRKMMYLPKFRNSELYSERSLTDIAKFMCEDSNSELPGVDLLAAALYSAERSKQENKILGYMLTFMKKDGMKSLQMAYKKHAVKLMDFELNDVDLDEASGEEVRTYCKMLRISMTGNRVGLVKRLMEAKEEIENNMADVEGQFFR